VVEPGRRLKDGNIKPISRQWLWLALRHPVGRQYGADRVHCEGSCASQAVGRRDGSNEGGRSHQIARSYLS